MSLLLKAGVHFSDPISIEVIYYWNGSGSHQIRVWPRGINAAFQIMWLITVQSWFNERGQLLPHIESCSVGERWRALSPNDIIIWKVHSVFTRDIFVYIKIVSDLKHSSVIIIIKIITIISCFFFSFHSTELCCKWILTPALCTHSFLSG